MNNLEKYLDRVIVQKPAAFEPPPEPDSNSEPFPIIRILRRWYIVLAVFLTMCAIGIPAIWRFIKPVYSVTGKIGVDPIIDNILTGEADSGEISNYQSFMYSQADIITDSRVVQRVADNLADKKLAFFEDNPARFATKLKQTLNNSKTKPEPAIILKQAILDNIITSTPAHRSERIVVTMKSTKPEEAKQIVDAFINAYMAVEVSSSAQEESRNLALLESERNVLLEKLQSQRDAIHTLAQEYGSKKLAGRYDMNLQRVAGLLTELTKVEATRLYLETRVKILEQTEEETIPPQELVTMREEYINNNPAVRALTTNIVQSDQALIVAEQTLAPTNPELQGTTEILEALKARLEEQKEDAGKKFDELMTKENANASRKKLINLQAELEQTQAYENQIRETLAKEDTETIGLGRTQLAIDGLEDELALTKELKDKIDRRILELEMERKRPARISVADNANISYIQDKRIKYTMALIFAAMACGTLLALLKDKADHSLRTPDEVVKRIGIPIIGTTTSSHTIKPARLPELIAGDYQTIRANLGLLDGNGMPRKLVITSPGMREGKTTFSVNLAISMSRSGKKVLLIDGDLRKPDIAALLNLPRGSNGLQDILFGREFKQAVRSIPSTGLDVLAADSSNAADAYELLASPLTAHHINAISQNYDHVIIDTPPVLAFPDALMWATIADAAILTSFAGQTQAMDLKKAKERLTQINVKVLGTILSNVRVGQSYYRYGYNYYAQNAQSKKTSRQANRKLLLPIKNENEKTKYSKTYYEKSAGDHQRKH